jgi:hypothetical protein
VHTPRFCGQASSAGTLLRDGGDLRGFLINWLIVGILFRPQFSTRINQSQSPKKAMQQTTGREERSCASGGWSCEQPANPAYVGFQGSWALRLDPVRLLARRDSTASPLKAGA